MASITMVSRLLDAADLLLTHGRRSGAYRRRAVSTAYYAVFHSLAKTCSETLLTQEKTDAYVRVYRALDHGPLKNAFAAGPLRELAHFREIGNIVTLLQSERHKADYLPPTAGVFGAEQAKQLVDQARDVIARIEELTLEDRRTLATHLLFKNRTQ
jgi:uncharacterized protein (UPF0332 family)